MYAILLAVGSLVATYVLSRLLGHMALRPWRKSVGRHWTARANLLYPARVTAGLCLLVLPVDIYLAVQWTCLQRYIPHFTGVGIIWLMLSSAFAGSILAHESFARIVYPDLKIAWFFRAWIANLLLRGGLVLVLCVTIFTMPSDFGLRTWLEAAMALAVLLAMQYGLARQILVWMRLFKPADDPLRKRVADIAGHMNVTVAKVWIFQTVLANAFALPVTRELIFSSTLLKELSDDEISAICAHELGHLTESRAVRTARQINALLLFPLVFIYPVESITHSWFLYPLIVLILAMGIKLFMARLARRMEVRADSMAIARQAQPAVYARALEKLYQINQLPAAMGRRKSVHPDLYDRMIAAGLTPDYAKPRPPQRHNAWSMLLYAALGVLCVMNLQQSASNLSSYNSSFNRRQSQQWLRNHSDYRSAPDSRTGPVNGPIQNIPLAPVPDNGGGDHLQRILFFQLQPFRRLHYYNASMKGTCL